ncbi:MAG: hypothetical protein ABSD97_10375 [Acidimicrobiales bacterium]|jgi:hypothetical protein
MQEIARDRNLNSQIHSLVEFTNVNAAEQVTAYYRRRVVPRRVLRTSNGVVQRGLRRLGLWR